MQVALGYVHHEASYMVQLEHLYHFICYNRLYLIYTWRFYFVIRENAMISLRSTLHPSVSGTDLSNAALCHVMK